MRRILSDNGKTVFLNKLRELIEIRELIDSKAISQEETPAYLPKYDIEALEKLHKLFSSNNSLSLMFIVKSAKDTGIDNKDNLAAELAYFYNEASGREVRSSTHTR